MSRVLHGMPISNLPDPGELDPDDQMVAYRQDDGKAYRVSVDDLVAEGTELLDRVYPVGSIYMSVNETSPAQLFGGTWTQIKDKFLLSAGDNHSNGETGGTETVLLSSSNLPSHTHSIPSLSGTAASAGAHTHGVRYEGSALASGTQRASVTDNGAGTANSIIVSAGAHTHSVTTNSSTTGSTGSGSAHENMPPYLTVYMWQRTA